MRYNKQKMIGDIIMREKTACFTGHREIPKKDMRKVRRNTLNVIIKAYENGYRYFGSGGAIGFDYEKKNVMRSESSDKRRIHTEYRKHFA